MPCRAESTVTSDAFLGGKLPKNNELAGGWRMHDVLRCVVVKPHLLAGVGVGCAIVD